MAKKVILKDLNEIEILPITRGELVLDSSGKKAFHSEEFLATSSLPGLMSKTDKTKVDNATTLSQAIPYIVGNASDSAGTWTGSYTGINEYKDGLTIIYVPKVAGASTTTLNINNLGAKTCHYTGTSKLTTHYAANTPILLTYLGGYWKRADYNVDTYTSAYSVTSGGTAGKTASCSGYQLKPNSYTHITFTNTNTYLGALTLNINSKGAKPIWINREASSSSNYTLPAGTYLAYYDGSSYHIRTDGTLPGIIEDSILWNGESIDNYNLCKLYDIDLSTLSVDNFYPVLFNNVYTELNCEIHSPSLAGSLPYNQNHIHFLLTAKGYSDTPKSFLILSQGNYSNEEITIGAVGAGNTDGYKCVWLRGGMKYLCLSNIEPVLYPEGYSSTWGEIYTFGTNLDGDVNTKVTIYWKNEAEFRKTHQVAKISDNVASASKVVNNLTLKIKSGTTEGTNLYTYNGSAAKTLDIKQGTGITLTAATNALTITNAGVRSIATGTANGTISVNTNGTSADVEVKGLDSAAYTNKNIYQKQATYVNNSGEVDVYKKITITKADTDGYGVWVHARHLHYLLNSGAAAMSTPMNTFWELGTSSNSGLVNRTISIKMIAPASSSNITLYVLVRAYTYILVVSSGTILIADSTQAEYDNITSSTTGWVECKSAKWTDTTYNVVSSSANGLAPKLINTNTNTVGSAYYVLASTNGSATPSWYKLPSTAFANDTKVTLTNTTASASYRVLLSGNANDTTETTTARKSANLLFNPNTEILSTTYVLAKGLKGKAESLEGLMNAGLALTYNRLSASSFSNETGITAKDNANGVLWVGTHGSEAGNTSGIGYGHMLGFVGSGGALYHKVVTNGNTSGSWKRIAYTTSDITGNAASADKLKTKRKLWGLDFDGTANVSGDMSSVGSISMSGSIYQVKGENKFASNTYTDPASGFNAAMKIAGGVAQNGANVLLCTTSGKTGIGTINPSEKLEVNGNVKATEFLGKLHWNYITNKPTSFTPAAHTHNELTWTKDVRNVETQPSDYKKVFKLVGIKSPSVIGLTEAQAGYWVSLIGWKGYNDNSGPHSWELASTNKERIYVRSGIGIQNSSSGTEDWKEWHNIAYTTDNFPSNQITSLLEYSKATSAADLATTDTLNIALGKLEYKAHYAYNWINTVTDTDLDKYINKWGEIVDFLDSVKEGTDILEEFVTVKTTQTISGQKTFSQPVLIKNENDRLTKIYSESQTEGVPEGNAGTVIQGGNFTHRLQLKDRFAGGCNYASLSGGYNLDGKLILNSYTIDTTAVTATVKSTTIISTAASSLGGSLSINGDLWFPAVDSNRFINFTSKSTTESGTNSWRLGYWGSEYGDKNYFILQSTTNTTSTWKNAFRITNETLFTEFYGNVKSTKFITSGGTASLFVKGDGSLDSTSYATSASLGNYLPLAGGTMTGNVVWKEGTGTGSRFPGHIYRNFWSTNGDVYDHFYPYGTTQTSNAYIRVWDGTNQSIRALLLSGSGSMKWCDKEVLHAGNYSNYLPTYDGNRMNKDTKFYKRYITVNGNNYAFVSNTNSSTSATIYAHTSVNKNRFSYSTSTGLSYTDLQYLKFVPNDNSGYPVYLLIADLTNWVNGTSFSALLIGTMYGQRAGNLARSVVYNICAHMTSYTGGSQWTLYTDIYNRRVLQPYVVIYNGTKYLALKKEGSLDNMYFVGLALGLLDTYVNVPCPNNTDLPEGLTIECSPTTTSMYLATTKVWDGTNARDIIHSGNYTTYSGYIGTTKVQATGAELSLTGIKNINASGTATIQGALSLGKADSSNLFFERTGPAYIWANAAGGYLTFGVKDVGGTSNTNASLVILAANVLPGMRNDAVELGSSSYRWKNVYSKLGNFLNQVLIGTETALKTDFILNVNGHTYQRGEVKITNDTHGLRLLGHGGAGYLLFGHTSDTTAEHYGHITGIGGVALTSLNIKSSLTTFLGVATFKDRINITNTSGTLYILMGNLDGSGIDKPAIIRAANGGLELGYGNSWSGIGGTFNRSFSVNASYVHVERPLTTANTAGSYKSGMTNAAIKYDNLENGSDASYHPILAVKTNSGNIFNIGKYNNSVGFYAFKSGRTENNYDYYFTCNTTTGDWTTGLYLGAAGFKKSNSSNSYALLGGGGHKALSDFALKSELNDLALSNNVITFTKEITVGSDWVDTGIVFNSTNFPLGNGSYLVLMRFSSGYYIYTGVMTVIVTSSVSLTHSEEILLHGGGFDMGLGHYYLRTYGDATDKVFKLQMARASNSGTRTYTFKFIKLL